MTRLRSSVRLAIVALTLGVPSVGCFNSEKLVERVRNNAIRTRIDEVKLGQYRVTLPRNPQTGEMAEVDVKVYGETLRYKINEIEDELKSRAPEIEDRTLQVLRETSREELADPNLVTLRERLLTSMNEVLTGAPLKSIGFYQVRFVRH
ncbi:flagellar basal body-associated FliL family protein [Botrimarina mediterranea]|uniref:Flagellar protein FliL n=1 Tax=Botrimarina mediterranea TaxID=2528022 RepID=A0A518KEF3_9BACT|nr:flagellar basal body-associated FliL family protein [Botrimarina mediterranea]QDV76186.1 Flagellar basal body-associated protein FliL [Botrimarina mediterranea]QDV80783.1 Flagellar basal body-associated protein FliL [Planctomycetes bacterium K2D]